MMSWGGAKAQRGRRLACGLLVAALLGLAPASDAQQNDETQCTAQVYDRVRSEAEIAGTIAACTRVLANPSASAAQRGQALYFRGLNHFLSAVNMALAENRALDPANADARGRVARALADLAGAIAATPEPSALPYSLRATIHSAMENYDAALADLAEAIRIDPKNSTHYAQRALIWERRDRFAEARADLDQAVSLDEKNQNAWVSRARLWTRYGDIDQAIADYTRAEAVGGLQTWNALSGRAKLRVRVAEPLHAFADWTKAGDLAGLPLLRAQFHVMAGNLARDYLKDADKTESSYRRALEILPSHGDAFIQRGIHYERTNRFNDALNDYKKAIEHGRDDPYARYRLELLQSRLARRTEVDLLPNIHVLSRSVQGAARDRGRRVALVVGNAAYGNVAPLANADRDAETVAQALSEAGFAKVTLGTNLNKQQLDGALQQFSGDAADADWAVIYYAGHGIEVDNRNFLIPVDASLDTLRNAAGHAVPIDSFMRAAGSAKTLRLVALDACRDNPFVQEAHRVMARNRTADPGAFKEALDRRSPIGGGFAGVQPPEPNTVVLYSTQPGQVALDGDDLNSPFTRAFVRNLPVRNLELALFFDRVRNDVAQATERRQWPSINGRLRADQRLSFFPI